MKASERGKQVTVLFELTARFDEEQNIEWAKRREEAGVHVIYGLIGMKTHCKTTLIMRREDGEIRRLRAYRHRQLQPRYSGVIHGFGIAHGRRRNRRRRDGSIQFFKFLFADK